MEKALIIIAQEGYQDTELTGTWKGIEEKGIEIVVASSDRGECRGKFGAKVFAVLALRDVHVADYDRVVFIGGPGAHLYASDPEALRIAREAAQTEKPLGAICIAPRILAAAGILRGRRATGD